MQPLRIAPASGTAAVRRVGIVLFPGFQVMNLTTLPVFELANELTGHRTYALDYLSEHGGRIVSSAGVAVETLPFSDERFDTVVVFGAATIGPSSPGLLDFVRRASETARRLASTCKGAFILAEAGVLDDRRATTHWAFTDTLQRLYPRVQVQRDPIFVVDGTIWTSAGMSAAIDLIIALVEHDLGANIARTIARKLVVYHRRPGGQSQSSVLLDLEPKTDRIQRALSYARDNLQGTLTVEDLADTAGLSPRQFSRRFREETGQSPAKAVERLRLEAARVMMGEGRHPIEVVARETGFADPERMRRAFRRAFGQPPQAIQRGLRHGGA